MGEAWSLQLEADPLLATLVGAAEGDGRLPDLSPEALEQRASVAGDLLERAEVLDSADLTADQQDDLDVLLWSLRAVVGDHKFGFDRMPLGPVDGLHRRFLALPAWGQPRTARDYDGYLRRLEGFPSAVDRLIRTLGLGVSEQRTLPVHAARRVAVSLERIVGLDLAEHPLWRPFERLPASIAGPQQRELLERAGAALEGPVRDGYRRLHSYWMEAYLPACRPGPSLRSGEEVDPAYVHAIRRYTSIDIAARQLHAVGAREVERLQAAMQRRLASVEQAPDLTDYLRGGGVLPGDTSAEPDQAMQRAAQLLKRVDGRLPELFGRLPRTPYGLRRVGDVDRAGGTTPGFYEPPAADGSRAGFVHLDPEQIGRAPRRLAPLLLHEGVPGHHLQQALTLEQVSLQPLRRFARLSAFEEGWALYAEGLGHDLQLYPGPREQLGRLEFELWRAARLVVDTGLHAFGWSRSQAVDYLVTQTSLDLDAASFEVDRYLARPGQALSYGIGGLRMRALRRRAEARLGERFDLRAFHDVVLGHGPLPLETLDRKVRQWIESLQPSTEPDDVGSPSGREEVDSAPRESARPRSNRAGSG